MAEREFGPVSPHSNPLTPKHFTVCLAISVCGTSAFSLFSLSLSVCGFIGQLVQLEEKGKGSVPWSVYGVYIKAAGGPIAFLTIMVLFILNVGSTAFSNWWLSYWIKQGSGVSDLFFKISRIIFMWLYQKIIGKPPSCCLKEQFHLKAAAGICSFGWEAALGQRFNPFLLCLLSRFKLPFLSAVLRWGSW